MDPQLQISLDKDSPEMKPEVLRVLKDLIHSQGWAFLRVHLDRLCQQREKAKSEALRAAKYDVAMRYQGEIDGINLWPRELELTINKLNEPENPEE